MHHPVQRYAFWGLNVVAQSFSQAHADCRSQPTNRTDRSFLEIQNKIT